MGLEGLSEPEIEALESHLLASVALTGAGTGNTTLLRTLGWDEDRYYWVRDRLIDRGVLERRAGRGGAVARVLEGPSTLSVDDGTRTAKAPPRSKRVAEAEHYGALATVLRSDWTRDKRFDNSLVEVTAKQGSKDTGGRWSRPDLVVVSLTTYVYVPGKHLDVTSFEVKPHDAMDVTAVYEALAHLRSATRAYVLLVVPPDVAEHNEQLIETICDEGKRHGIGVIVAADPSDYSGWDERVEAVRHEMDPYKVNEFLSKQLTEGSKDQLLKWYR